MTTLATHILLGLVLGLVLPAGLACDSNPTPHPGQPDAYKADIMSADAYAGEVAGNVPPGREGESPVDDLDPANPDNDGATGAFDGCPPDADASDAAPADEPDGDEGDGAATEADDDVRMIQHEGDCGPEEATPAPAAASDNAYGRVE
jgi:hypothetical protein